MEWVQFSSICDMLVVSSSVLGILLEVRPFGGSHVSLCCGLYGEREMLGFLRTFERRQR